jgi:hypothetical protein
MMNRHATSRALAALVLALALPLATWLPPAAAQQTAASETAMPAGDIPDVLRARSGKAVTLLLRSGKEYGGTVGEVRGQSVVLKSIAGKEFYDALIRLDDISAVEIRNR